MNITQLFKSKLSLNSAIITYAIITIIALLYHTLIITQVVDYKNAWGGNLPSVEAMYVFEVVSVVLQLVFAGIVFVKFRSTPGSKIAKVTSGLLIIIASIFALNTVGNIFAKEIFERLLFTPLTFFAAIASARIAIE
jgi:hypothetical protein